VSIFNNTHFLCVTNKNLGDTVFKSPNSFREIQSSVVIVATRLQTVWSRVRILVWTRDVSFSKNIQTGSGVHQSSFLMVKQLRHEVNSPPFGSNVKNKCTHNSSLPICLHDKDRQRNLPFTFNSCSTQTQWRFHMSNSSKGSNAMWCMTLAQ